MAGMGQAFGVLLLILGVLSLLTGLGAVGYAYFEEQDNQEDNLGLTQSADTSERNTTIAYVGAGAAALGLLLLIIGGLSIGIGRQRTDARAANGRGPPVRHGKSILIGGVILFLFVAAIAAAVTLSDAPLADRLGDGGTGTSAVGNATLHGNVTAGVNTPVAPVNLDPSGENGDDFYPPGNASRLDGVLDWTPAGGGAERLLIQITLDGEVIAQAEGTGPLMFNATFPAGSTLHYAVFSSGTAPTAQQSFRIDVTYWT